MTDFHDDEFEARLRAGLHDRARHAPDAGPVTDDILAAVESGAAPSRGPDHPRWRSWALPLVAAAAVAAVVGGAVGISHVHLDADKNPPARQSTVAPSTPDPAPTTTAPVSPSTSATVPGPGTVALTNLHVRDLTFVGADQGWALGTADCLSGSGTCTALAYTSDGRSWGGRGTTPFNVPGDTVGCGDPCVTHLRFADTNTGYAFGPSALFLTTDGAHTWQRLDGGASSLEVLAGYVLRIRPTPGVSCASCGTLQRSDIGSTTWTTVTLPRASSSTVVTSLSPIGVKGAAVLANPSLAIPQTDLYAFLDGTTWTNLGQPCQGDAVHVAGAAGDGAIAVECAAHEGGAGSYPDYVTVSTDGGQTFGPHRTITPAGGYTDLLVAASATHLLAARDGVVRFSGDGGQSWQTSAPSGTVDFAGFESASVGRVVTNGTTIWTTRDGGASWTSIQLP
jgi:photosystem II stability/assembly factor-like uncharacterized protein